MKVLLSIKPEYANKIFSGEKKFEYRKLIFKREIKFIVVYATKPVGMIIGEFEIDKIISDTPKQIWNLTKEHAGIEEDKFKNYFSNKETGFAIKVKKAKLYKHSKTLKEYNPKIKVPPQSFCYI
jgi:hypothetical protein